MVQTCKNERDDVWVCELLDANGNAFAAYHYDAWGLPQGSGTYATGIWTASTSLINSTLAGQIASEQVLRYASYVYDPESGLYYCSARYYDPATRQWTTADSAKADGEESAYQYCEGGPLAKVDATGRSGVPWPIDAQWLVANAQSNKTGNEPLFTGYFGFWFWNDEERGPVLCVKKLNGFNHSSTKATARLRVKGITTGNTSATTFIDYTTPWTAGDSWTFEPGHGKSVNTKNVVTSASYTYGCTGAWGVNGGWHYLMANS